MMTFCDLSPLRTTTGIKKEYIYICKAYTDKIQMQQTTVKVYIVNGKSKNVF